MKSYKRSVFHLVHIPTNPLFIVLGMGGVIIIMILFLDDGGFLYV